MKRIDMKTPEGLEISVRLEYVKFLEREKKLIAQSNIVLFMSGKRSRFLDFLEDSTVPIFIEDGCFTQDEMIKMADKIMKEVSV